MSTRLVILGLLRDRPLHGYEIKHVIEDHMGDWTNIAFGSIYVALKKLAEEGFVEQLAVEQEGSRPARTVFQITEEGRVEFLRLLRSVWKDVERHYYGIDIGLAFLDALTDTEVKGYLEARIEQLEESIRHLSEHQETVLAIPEVPRRAIAVFQHSRLHLEAELTWTLGLLVDFERESFTGRAWETARHKRPSA